jgi:hypothetical protein
VRAPVLGLLCACNAWYGLDDTEIAPRDAPVTCPPIGTAPAFGKTVREIVYRFCVEYSVSPSRTLAVAMCNRGVVQGPPDGEDLVANGLPMNYEISTSPAHSFTYSYPVAVDANRIFVHEHELDGPVNTFRTIDYRKTASGMWQRETFLPIAAASERFGTVARIGDTLRVIASSTDGTFREYVEDTGGWRLAGSVPKTSLGITGFVERVSLSDDALRMWISVQLSPVAYYTDRASIDSPWRAAVEVEAPPVDTMMTADCARLYFNGRQSVFYVERR